MSLFKVVPQPVYMNTAALAQAAKAREAAEAEGLDLKTPTAEDLGCLGSDAPDDHSNYNGRLCRGWLILVVA